MAEEKTIRLSQAARKLNVGISTIADYLSDKGYEIDSKPNTKITMEQFNMLHKEYADSALDKEEALGMTIGKKHNDNVTIDDKQKTEERKTEEEERILIKGLSAESNTPPSTTTSTKQPASEEPEVVKTKEPTDTVSSPKLQGLNVVGKIDLDNKKKPAEPEQAPKVEEKPKEEEKPAAEVKPKAEEKPKVEEKPAPEAKAEEKPAPQAKPEVKEEAPVAKQVEEAPKKEEKPAKAETPAPAAEKKEEKPTSQQKPAAEQKPKAEEKKAAPTQQAAKPAAKKEEKPAKPAEEKPAEGKVIEAKADQLRGLKVLGKIELPTDKKKAKPVASSDDKSKNKKDNRKKRKRIQTDNGRPGGDNQNRGGNNQRGGGNNRNQNQNRRGKKNDRTEEVSDKEVQEKIKATLAKLTGGKTGQNRSKYRREKRSQIADANLERQMQEQEDSKVLHVTEFISANDLASLMGVSVNDIIRVCMGMGMFVSINQRLDAETITVITDEFGYQAEFNSAEEEITIEVKEDTEEELSDRAPIVTIMGHVDHGKTSLLDYIRSANVTAGEAGGITQHIGAYDVMTDGGKRIAFLDTPGHEAFTAMRARGAKVTDVVIIVVAADDAVMPQTKEAINHAQLAGVPIVIAINKIDKPNANSEKIREELANINILVEDWGGKYQCQEISAKSGLGIDELLEKVLLEAELLELKANPDRDAVGTIIEASLDKGRGYVATALVQTGTLQIGDIILAGQHYGRVKAMFDHRSKKMKKAGPATPVVILGLDGAPQAGDKLNVLDTEREAREVANKRQQIHREQSMRTKKHITLDEIGRRLAIGNFKELNVIVKGDVDGSVEALSDSLLKLSTDEVAVNIIHKAVGQISESDVLLASASDAIIIGFQVRPSANARRLAENEEIEIRLYSIIYDAINELKDAMEGLLAPTVEEVIVGNAEVREVFKISKVGTVAGCMITDGLIKRNNNIRLIRDGIVTYSGELGALKRFKDDVNEVKQGFECGMSIKNFNDIKVGDVIESYEEREVKRSLS